MRASQKYNSFWCVAYGLGVTPFVCKYERVQEKEAAIFVMDTTQKLLSHCVYETTVWRVIIFRAPA